MQPQDPRLMGESRFTSHNSGTRSYTLRFAPEEYVFSPWRAPSLILASLPRNLYRLPLLLFNCRCGSPLAFLLNTSLEVCACPAPHIVRCSELGPCCLACLSVCRGPCCWGQYTARAKKCQYAFMIRSVPIHDKLYPSMIISPTHP